MPLYLIGQEVVRTSSCRQALFLLKLAAHSGMLSKCTGSDWLKITFSSRLRLVACTGDLARMITFLADKLSLIDAANIAWNLTELILWILYSRIDVLF